MLGGASRGAAAAVLCSEPELEPWGLRFMECVAVAPLHVIIEVSSTWFEVLDRMALGVMDEAFSQFDLVGKWDVVGRRKTHDLEYR